MNSEQLRVYSVQCTVQVQRLAQQLASALQYLRQHNVSHLDLKPSNLLVSGKRPALLKVANHDRSPLKEPLPE